MVDVECPRAVRVAALVLGHLVAVAVIDAHLLAVELHDDGLPREAVGHGVVASLDGYGGLLVHGALQQVEAPEVAREVEHALHVPAQGPQLVAHGHAAALGVQGAAYPVQPQLRGLDGNVRFVLSDPY